MARIIQIVSDNQERQGAGHKINTNRSRVYAFDLDNPLTLYDTNGIMITEAPEYTLTEASPVQDLRIEGGQNTMIDTYESDDYVRSKSVVIGLNRDAVNPMSLLRSAYARGKRFGFFSVPVDDCPDACDRWAFYFGDNTQMGVIQRTNGVISGDSSAEGGGAITRTIRLRTSGDFAEFFPIVYSGVTQEDLLPLYTVLLGTQAQCEFENSFCPWQVAFIGGGEGGTDPSYLARTVNKFGTLAALTGALAVGDLAVASAYYNGLLYVGHSTVYKATGSTSGGLVSSLNGAVSVAVAGVTSDGIHALVVAGNRLHAFGESGDWFYTDNGTDWVTATPFTTEDIFAAAYDPRTQIVYAVGSGGAAYAIRPNGAATAIAGLSTVTDDFLSVAVLGNDHIAVGDDTGEFHESFGANAGDAWVSRQFAADPINAIVGDGKSTRAVISVGDAIWERSINSLQEWNLLGTAPGDITAMDIGYNEYQRGKDYIVAVTVTGEVVEIQQCNPCNG